MQFVRGLFGMTKPSKTEVIGKPSWKSVCDMNRITKLLKEVPDSFPKFENDKYLQDLDRYQFKYSSTRLNLLISMFFTEKVLKHTELTQV